MVLSAECRELLDLRVGLRLKIMQPAMAGMPPASFFGAEEQKQVRAAAEGADAYSRVTELCNKAIQTVRRIRGSLVHELLSTFDSSLIDEKKLRFDNNDPVLSIAKLADESELGESVSVAPYMKGLRSRDAVKPADASQQWVPSPNSRRKGILFMRRLGQYMSAKATDQAHLIKSIAERMKFTHDHKALYGHQLKRFVSRHPSSECGLKPKRIPKYADKQERRTTKGRRLKFEPIPFLAGFVPQPMTYA